MGTGSSGSPLVTIGGKGPVIRRVRRIWARAGVEPWARLWQTLRSSCEKEWAMTFPQYAVSKWIGHSIAISGRHYANAVPDELFDKAAGSGVAPRNSAQRHAQPKASDRPRIDQKPTTTRVGQLAWCPSLARFFRALRERRKMEPGGIEPPSRTVSRAPLRV